PPAGPVDRTGRVEATGSGVGTPGRLVRVSIKRTARVGVVGVVTRAGLVQLDIPGLLSCPTGIADAREATVRTPGEGSTSVDRRGWITRRPDHQSTSWETAVSELESAGKLTATRDGWHRVAEHVLAAAQYGDTGKIGLRPSTAGFATARPLHGGRQLRVAEAELIVTDSAGSRSAPLTRLAQPPGSPASRRGCRSGYTNQRHRWTSMMRWLSTREVPGCLRSGINSATRHCGGSPMRSGRTPDCRSSGRSTSTWRSPSTV